jgi:phosphoribosylanthranilate isomerase
MRTVEQAEEILRGAGAAVRRVGVFADQPAFEIGRVAERLRLDVVQLHGDANDRRAIELRASFSGDIWPVLRVSNREDLSRRGPGFLALGDALLLDAYTPGALGGTGVALPWTELAVTLDAMRGTKTIILAGGLKPDNVAQAIAALSPNIVDVSSGVESAPGVKDHDRMRAFRDAVTHASIAS